MMRKRIAPLALCALAWTAACERSTLLPGSELDSETAAALAADFSSDGGGLIGGQMAGSFSLIADEQQPRMETVTTTRNFDVTRTCAQGGSAENKGSAVTTFDRTSRSGTFQLNAVHTANACVHARRNGASVTITTQPNIVVAANGSITNGVPGVYTMTHRGAFEWTAERGSGTCQVDITSSYDPATQTRKVSGTICNRTIDVTRTKQS